MASWRELAFCLFRAPGTSGWPVVDYYVTGRIFWKESADSGLISVLFQYSQEDRLERD